MPNVDSVELAFAGRTVQIEYRWIQRERTDAPLVLFLHEGLGSAAMWRDFPDALCQAGGLRGLVYSRYGYGASTPRPRTEPWPFDYLHRQAADLLPAFLDTVAGEREKPWLFGHSDGASIALIYAALFPERPAGVIALAPHVMVEEVALTGIRRTQQLFHTTDMPEKLARYHRDAESVFWGWHDVWLDPSFRAWSIEALLPAIRCPVLAIQGYDDEYGTMEQLDCIERGAPQVELLKLGHCGHTPHRDQPDLVIDATLRLIRPSGDTVAPPARSA
jgi:pimeloyl-ACP methyl ester carboxylesterase